MAKKFEGTAADRAMDKKGAKKAGMTLKQWENSPQDRAKDKKMRAKMKKKKKS